MNSLPAETRLRLCPFEIEDTEIAVSRMAAAISVNDRFFVTANPRRPGMQILLLTTAALLELRGKGFSVREQVSRFYRP